MPPVPSYGLRPSDEGTEPPAMRCLVPSLQWAVAPFWGMQNPPGLYVCWRVDRLSTSSPVLSCQAFNAAAP
jgi:hypothetical protein